MKYLFNTFLLFSLAFFAASCDAQGQYTFPHDHSAPGKGGPLDLSNLSTATFTDGTDTFVITEENFTITNGTNGNYIVGDVRGANMPQFEIVDAANNSQALFRDNYISLNDATAGALATLSVASSPTLSLLGVNDAILDSDGLVLLENGGGAGVVQISQGTGFEVTDSTNTSQLTPTSLSVNGIPHLHARQLTKAANTSRTSSTTFADDDVIAGMVLPIGQYSFTALLEFDSSSATPDGKYRLNFTGSGSVDKFLMTAVHFSHNESTVTTYQVQTAATNHMVVDLDGATTQVCVINGSFRVSSNTVTAALQWAQNSSDGTATVLGEASYLRFEKSN